MKNLKSDKTGDGKLAFSEASKVKKKIYMKKIFLQMKMNNEKRNEIKRKKNGNKDGKSCRELKEIKL